MGSGRDHITILKRTRDNVGSHQTTDVSHISKKYCFAFVGYFSNSLVVDKSGVGTGSCNDHLRSEECGMFFQFVIVNETSGFLRREGSM